MNDKGKKQPLLVLAGPTAVGKTELSLRLAEELNGAVISADSMQVYRYMDVGSAKIMPEERRGIPHYLIDVLDPEEDFNVFRFQQMAGEAIAEIREKGMLPILTGGTGFYIQAVLKNINFTENEDHQEIRRQMEELAQAQGTEEVYRELQKLDPEAAAEIHPHNVKRVIRAIEYYQMTGKPISAHNREQRERRSAYHSALFVLTDERQRLYENINRRVDHMMENGLVEEVRRLVGRGLTEDNVSMKGIGYRELFPYFRGEISLEQAVEDIKKDTRHFAKRQITWFKREEDAIWVNKRDFGYDEEKILAYLLKTWRELPED
jgi:tRNA dimethylallyltransferase